MKRVKSFALIAFVLFSVGILSSCSSSRRGSKCDCPKFGENQAAPSEQLEMADLTAE